MTLAEILREVGELGCRSPRIQQDLKGWVNRSQRAIAQRRNWTFMHSRQSVTITSGNTSATLPALFKCLSPGKTPISYTAPTAQFPTPCIVKSREELEQVSPGYLGLVANASGYWTPFYVFLEQNDDGLWTLNTPRGYVHAASSTYVVSCFLYPPDMVEGDDETSMTKDGELIEALINKTRALAYFSEDPTDQRGLAAQQMYDSQISRACSQDARRNLIGRSIRW